MGRPELPIDEKLVRRAARISCTDAEIAHLVGCHVDTIRNRFRDVIDEEREKGKASLRRMQWKSAKGGSVTMQIWLGKQLLKQTDKQEVQYLNVDLDKFTDEQLARLERGEPVASILRETRQQVEGSSCSTTLQ